MSVNPINGASSAWSTSSISSPRHANRQAAAADPAVPARPDASSSAAGAAPSPAGSAPVTSSSLWDALLTAMSGSTSSEDSLLGGDPAPPGPGIDLLA